jgi:hypothetical protein
MFSQTYENPRQVHWPAVRVIPLECTSSNEASASNFASVFERTAVLFDQLVGAAKQWQWDGYT